MKKALALLLSLCILLSVLILPASAAQDCSCGHLPIVVVSGMGAMPFYLNEGTPQQIEFRYPAVPDVPALLLKAGGGILRSLVSFSARPFVDAVVEIALDVLSVASCDADGNSISPMTPVTMNEPMSAYNADVYAKAGDAEFSILNAAVEAVGADHTYFYNYDWRLDPLDNADDLDAFIARVCKQTGHEKVRLAACSMGGVQTMAYLYKFGHAQIDTIWFLSAAWNGLLFVTNAFSGEIQLEQDSFFTWLQTLEIGSDRTDALMDALFDRCRTTPLLRPVFRLLGKITDGINGDIEQRVIRATLGSTPGMWCFVRDDRYDEAKQNMLSDASETFLRRVDTYHYNVLCRREEIIADAVADGVQVLVFSHYNNGCVPVTSSAKAHGDNLIETTCSSGGAVVADCGSTLPSGYTQQADCGHNHISPDRVIDASVCTLPERTWFIKNMNHVGCKNHSDYWEMLRTFFAADVQPDVYTYSAYPQFLQTDPRTQMTLEPVR